MTDDRPQRAIFSRDEDDEHDDDQYEDDEQPPRKRRGCLFILFVFTIGVLVLLLAVAGFYIGRALSAVNSIDRDPLLTPTDYSGRPPATVAKPAEPGEKESKPPLNFVLMGSDSRGEDQGRSDSLMVAHVTGDREAVYLISFPRDMWVDIPGRGKGKINWAYSFGGPQLTVRTLEQLTGVRMDHTVVIDFEGFIRLTEAIGGVTVYNPWTTEQNEGQRFEKGELTLQGERALVYVRERYPLPNGDLDRAFRQRTVLKAIIRKLLTPATVINPVTFSDVVGKVADTMTVDSEMTGSYVTDLGMSMRITSGESIGLLQAPILGFARVQGQAVDVVDKPGVAALSKAMAEDTMDEYFAVHKNDSNDMLGQVEPPE